MSKQIYPFFDQRVEDYCQKCLSAEPETLKKLERITHLRLLKPRMISGNWQGTFLKILSLMVQPTRILELGTFSGYSTICLCEGLKAGGEMHTIERDESLEPFLREVFAENHLENTVKLHIGNALQIIPNLDFCFDIIFIDADKASYCEYYNLCIDKLKTGGLLIADNVLWYGKVALEPSPSDKETTAIKNFNALITQDDRMDSLIIPLRDGIMIGRKKEI